MKSSAIGIVGDFDRNEVKEVRWVSVEEIKSMISENKINDGLSLTVLMLHLLSL